MSFDDKKMSRKKENGGQKRRKRSILIQRTNALAQFFPLSLSFSDLYGTHIETPQLVVSMSR